jgi:hypothetical protein
MFYYLKGFEYFQKLSIVETQKRTCESSKYL